MSKVTQSFASKVAAYLGADPQVVYSILSQWEPWENANAAHNPLATTQHAPGSQPLGGNPNQNNGNPVQEYPSEDIGAQATAKTLANGYYPDVLNWIKTGTLANPEKAAAQIRTWGTTGFANQISGGNVSGSSGGTSMTSPASTTTTGGRDEFFKWAEAQGYAPPDPKDYPPVYVKDDKGNDTKTVASSTAQQLQEAQAAYFKGLGSLAAIWNATKSPTAKGELSPDQKAQQDIKNKMDALDLQVKAGTLDAQKAATELTAFINEQKNALDLGTQQQKAREQIDLYGAGGDFSYNDMGGAFADYAGRNGIDANSSALRFTTPQPFDPAAAYKTNAATMGITGTPQPQNTMLDLIQKAMAGNDGATGSIGGAASGGLGDVGAAVSAAADAMQPQYIIPGATVGAGAAPSGLSPDAITPYVPPWAGRTLQKPPQLVGGL